MTVSNFNIDTLWLSNIAMENGPFIDDFPIKNLHLFSGFSMAMLVITRGYILEMGSAREI